MRKCAFFALASLFLASCAVGPDYVKPAPDTPPAWRMDYEAAAGLADLAWWEKFGDPVLNGLIQEALKENKDLKIAAARVDQYLGALDTTRSQFFPQLSGTASVSRQKDTETGPVPIPSGVSSTYNTNQAYLSVSWEIDIWGRIRRATEAARADLLATEEGRRAVILSLATNVANGYLTLRALDRQLEIAGETEKAYAKTLQLFRLRHKYGTISRLELSQVESQYESAAQAIPQAQNAFREVDDALVGTIKGREKLASQERQVDALKDYARIARLQYEGGTASYFIVLDAESSLFNAQISYVQTQSNIFHLPGQRLQVHGRRLGDGSRQTNGGSGGGREIALRSISQGRASANFERLAVGLLGILS